MATRRLILKAVGAGKRPQVVLDLDKPARLSQADLERAMGAAVESLGAKVQVADRKGVDARAGKKSRTGPPTKSTPDAEG